MKKQNEYFNWSIGLYTGDAIDNLIPLEKNPILTRHDVLDCKAEFVADPFLLKKDEVWYLFFEVLNLDSKKGEIAVATSTDFKNWTYEKIVLVEHFHLSYPYVFCWNDDIYMIPETLGSHAIQLYKAQKFPYEWQLETRLIEGQFADPSIFYFENKWWIFACSDFKNHNNLHLYFASNLKGPYEEHPQSPVVENDPVNARPAGRVLVLEDKIIRFAQNCKGGYGLSVKAFEIYKLNDKEYLEKPMLQDSFLSHQKEGWNSSKMHHIDAQRQSNQSWIACADGNDRPRTPRT